MKKMILTGLVSFLVVGCAHENLSQDKGDNCTFKRESYSIGAVAKMADGQVYECVKGELYVRHEMGMSRQVYEAPTWVQQSKINR